MRKINENELRIVDAGDFYWGKVTAADIDTYIYGFFNGLGNNKSNFCYKKEKLDEGQYSKIFLAQIRGFILFGWGKSDNSFQLVIFDVPIIGK